MDERLPQVARLVLEFSDSDSDDVSGGVGKEGIDSGSGGNYTDESENESVSNDVFVVYQNEASHESAQLLGFCELEPEEKEDLRPAPAVESSPWRGNLAIIPERGSFLTYRFTRKSSFLKGSIYELLDSGGQVLLSALVKSSRQRTVRIVPKGNAVESQQKDFFLVSGNEARDWALRRGSQISEDLFTLHFFYFRNDKKMRQAAICIFERADGRTKPLRLISPRPINGSYFDFQGKDFIRSVRNNVFVDRARRKKVVMIRKTETHVAAIDVNFPIYPHHLMGLGLTSYLNSRY
jgi:hypothetical protein